MEGLELKGLDEMINNLDMTVEKMNRGVARALKESAEPVKKAIKKNTNRSDGQTHKWENIHAQDDVWISGVVGREDDKHVKVLYKNVGWRMYFVEFGTSKQKPQHIIQTSVKQTESQVRQKQTEVLREVLR